MDQAAAETAPIKDPIRLKVAGMDCGSCALTIESSLRQLAGVDAASVSFTTETLEVSGNISVAAIAARLKELGYRIADASDIAPLTMPEHRGLKGFLRFLWQQPPLRRSLLVAAAVLGSIAVIPALDLNSVAGMPTLTLVFGIAVLVAGAPIFIKGLRSLIFARRVTIDLLMSIAAFGAIGIGATGEAITVILLFMLGEALEAYSAERARDSLRSLMSLQPQEANVLETHAGQHGSHEHGAQEHAHQVTKPVEQVIVGDRVLVRPAERIPVDGQIIKGVSSVNQAPVTGEDMPVLRQVGDEVMAGTVNGEAAIEVRVTRPASEGTIARIAKLVEQAQAQRSPAERFIDRFARYYTPAVVAMAMLVVVIPVLVFAAPLLDTADGTRGWLYRGLTLLIIACPCALVISIPVTVVSGLTRLAQLGVLVKSGALLDRMADVQTIAFDKTGTLTRGTPIVTSMRTADCAHEADQYDECAPCDAAVSAAASVERASEHPVANAIVAAASNRANGNGHVSMAQDVQAHPGQGVSGVLNDGARVRVGSRNLFNQTEEGWDSVAPHADAAQDEGETIMYVSHNDKVIGYIGVQDEIREGSTDVLTELANMKPPIRTVMLTGDNPQSAARVANRLNGIDEVHAGLLPAEKLSGIEALHSRNAAVAMVGDGINDAPALARADIGIAMGGSGTAQAMETADVVLMQDDLSHVPLALRIARKSRAVIKQNIVLSLALKLVFLALAIPGIATLWMAVLADVGATLLVTLNGMRLLRQR